MKKQVLLLSALVWGLVLFAPFPGSPGIRLMSSFDAYGTVGTGHTGMERVLSSPEQSFRTADIEMPSSASEAELATSHSLISQPVESKLTGSTRQLSYLSSQDCQQHLTRPCIQDYFALNDLLEMGVTKNSETTLQRSNREPILIAHSGNYSGWSGTPRRLPPGSDREEGKQNEHEPRNRSLLYSDDFAPGYAHNDTPNKPARVFPCSPGRLSIPLSLSVSEQ